MRYRFANARHLELFKADPDKYAPQFGGLCTMNMSAGVRREADPANWVISNGNLYVFAGAPAPTLPQDRRQRRQGRQLEDPQEPPARARGAAVPTSEGGLSRATRA